MGRGILSSLHLEIKYYTNMILILYKHHPENY